MEKLRTQGDNDKRVVCLSNLYAMCERVSGVCHSYRVERVTANRVHISYSNPSEYGTPNPFEIVLPCYPNPFEKENPYIIMEIIRTVYEPKETHGEGWQDFCPLLDCPPLFRVPQTGEGEGIDWKSKAQIEAEKEAEKERKYGDKKPGSRVRIASGEMEGKEGELKTIGGGEDGSVWATVDVDGITVALSFKLSDLEPVK